MNGSFWSGDAGRSTSKIVSATPSTPRRVEQRAANQKLDASLEDVAKAARAMEFASPWTPAQFRDAY